MSVAPNDLRESANRWEKHTEMALAVVACDRSDLLVELLASVVACEQPGPLHLVLVQEWPLGLPPNEDPGPDHAAVTECLELFAEVNSGTFASVTVVRREWLMGSGTSCAVAMDLAFEKADFAIFCATGGVLARDSLRWFDFGRGEVSRASGIHAVSAVSEWFRIPGSTPVADLLDRVRLEMDDHGLVNLHDSRQWLPPANFATDRAGWERLELAARPLVDLTSIGQRFRSLGLTCLQPVVPRARSLELAATTPHWEGGRRAVTSDDSTLVARRFESFDGSPDLLDRIAATATLPASDKPNQSDNQRPARPRASESPATPLGDPEAQQPVPREPYIDLLDAIHRERLPRLYLQIGMQDVAALRLARQAVIAVDPAPSDAAIDIATGDRFRVAHQTSSEFFGRDDLPDMLDGNEIDFAFIDGMHRFATVLEEFISIERRSAATGIIAIHDVIPPTIEAGHREPVSGAWCGDVWLIVDCLAVWRPNLTMRLEAAAPSGLLVISGLDPANRTLPEHLTEILSSVPADGADYDAALRAYLARVAQ